MATNSRINFGNGIKQKLPIAQEQKECNNLDHTEKKKKREKIYSANEERSKRHLSKLSQ